VAKITAQKSKTILTDIERWQKVNDIGLNFDLFFYPIHHLQNSYYNFLLQGVASTDGKFLKLHD